MASEYLQDFACYQLSKGIMTTANTIAGSSGGSNPVAQSSASEGGLFDGIVRRFKKVTDVIQDVVAPLKRRSMYDELPEYTWPAKEHIEMANIAQRNIGKGHHFVPCQLTKPDWCDCCGDFIWGLYKQCLRCQNCQYTCHQHCLSSVNLGCKLHDGSTTLPASASQVPNTPSPDRALSLETSLTKGARPGVAHCVRESSSQNAPPKVSESVPNMQVYSHNTAHTAQVQTDTTEVTQTPSHLSRSLSESSVSCPPSLTHVTATHPEVIHESSASDDLEAVVCEGEDSDLGQDLIRSVHVTEETLANPAVEAENENEETDSGYRSGTIPDDKLRVPSQATLDRQELKRKIAKYNHFVPAANFEATGRESFQGFVKVTMNLIRPITMELGARPPSIYELLTREHIIEENTQQVAFYMPRDTHKSLHIVSETTTKELVSSLLKKFHILDHPRKFAMYEQEFNEKNKLVRLKRLHDKDCPLRTTLDWDPERIGNYRLVLQENETGEIVWENFSLPELSNFLKVLEREEKETILELRHKYIYMRQFIDKRLTEMRNVKRKSISGGSPQHTNSSKA